MSEDSRKLSSKIFSSSLEAKKTASLSRLDKHHLSLTEWESNSKWTTVNDTTPGLNVRYIDGPLQSAAGILLLSQHGHLSHNLEHLLQLFLCEANYLKIQYLWKGLMHSKHRDMKFSCFSRVYYIVCDKLSNTHNGQRSFGLYQDWVLSLIT